MLIYANSILFYVCEAFVRLSSCWIPNWLGRYNGIRRILSLYAVIYMFDRIRVEEYLLLRKNRLVLINQKLLLCRFLFGREFL